MVRYFGVLVFLLISLSLMGQEKQRPVQPDIPGDVMLDFGWNLMMEKPKVLETRWWPSSHIGLNYMWTTKLNDYFTFNPQIGFSFEKIGLLDRLNYQLNDDYTFSWDTIHVSGLKKNKIAMTFVEIPLELRYYPIKTVAGEGMFFGFGGIAGYRLESHTKVVYKQGGSRRKDLNYGDFGINDFRYGIVGRYGVKGFNLYVKYYFPDVWKKGPIGANPRFFTFGVNLTLF